MSQLSHPLCTGPKRCLGASSSRHSACHHICPSWRGGPAPHPPQSAAAAVLAAPLPAIEAPLPLPLPLSAAHAPIRDTRSSTMPSWGLTLDAQELLNNVCDLEELGSHVQLPRAAPELYGNWAVVGPAVIRRVGCSLRALVRGGGWVSLGASLDTVLSADDATPGSLDASGAPITETAFELHGTHVELSGPFKLLAREGTREHGGRVILTVPQLQEDNCILLLPGGCLSHPLCATPQLLK